MTPYLITGPALISFSGGRSSGYMLRQILLAHGGMLPADVYVCFCNTGKERLETLNFVQAVSDHYGVPIHWLERPPGGGYVEVSHNSASRAGEPFAQLITEKQYLPNPVTRFCTIELKIRVMRDFARSLGWERWTNVVGLRADEGGRVIDALARNDAGKERFTTIMPMASAGVTKAMVLAFWAAQAFDLRLRDYEGNCDLCFLKGKGKIIRIMQEHPELGGWWVGKEEQPIASKPGGARFRDGRPGYAALADFADRQGVLDLGDDDDDILESCGPDCTQ